MTATVLSSPNKEVVIGFDRPFVVIGERINPTGRKKLAAEIATGDYSTVESDAVAQVAAGAHVLDVNAGVPNADEAAMMTDMIKLVQGLVDVPLCIDSAMVPALEAGLIAYDGKAFSALIGRTYITVTHNNDRDLIINCSVSVIRGCYPP